VKVKRPDRSMYVVPIGRTPFASRVTTQWSQAKSLFSKTSLPDTDGPRCSAAWIRFVFKKTNRIGRATNGARNRIMRSNVPKIYERPCNCPAQAVGRRIQVFNRRV